MDDRRITEADMHSGFTGRAFQRPLQRSKSVLPRGVGARLHIGFVYLHHVATRRKQRRHLFAHGTRIVHRRIGITRVKVVLGLLRHRERAGQRHFDRPTGAASEELCAFDLYRAPPANLADNSRDRIRLTRPVERLTRRIQIYALESVGEAVGVAFATHLAIRYDVEASSLLCEDCDQGGIILGFDEVGLTHTPEFRRPDARR